MGLWFAAAMQAMRTLSLALVSSIPPLWPIRMANGFFLAALRPISNGIVSDLASTKEQGHYFGLMQGFVNLGSGLTAMIVGGVAESTFDIPLFGPGGGASLLLSCHRRRSLHLCSPS